MAEGYDLDSAIRKIPDFPKPGILFYDITGILARPEAFRFCIERMKALYGGAGLTAVAAVEARGFLFAAPFAAEMGLPLILVRKKGKLPGPTWQIRFQLEYGEDVIEVHRSDVLPGAQDPAGRRPDRHRGHAEGGLHPAGDRRRQRGGDLRRHRPAFPGLRPAAGRLPDHHPHRLPLRVTPLPTGRTTARTTGGD